MSFVYCLNFILWFGYGEFVFEVFRIKLFIIIILNVFFFWIMWHVGPIFFRKATFLCWESCMEFTSLLDWEASTNSKSSELNCSVQLGSSSCSFCPITQFWLSMWGSRLGVISLDFGSLFGSTFSLGTPLVCPTCWFLFLVRFITFVCLVFGFGFVSLAWCFCFSLEVVFWCIHIEFFVFFHAFPQCMFFFYTHLSCVWCTYKSYNKWAIFHIRFL